jgi:predicted amidophosphoribosyltransferase
MEPLAAIEDRCEVCDHPYNEGERRCWNPVCGFRPADRWFEWNYAIAMRTKWLRSAINAYKYEGRREWAAIFGRILVGFLEAERGTFENVDLIVASPAYTGVGAHRTWNHVQEILVAADREQEYRGLVAAWPIDLADPQAIVKTADTPTMVGLNRGGRQLAAEQDLRHALHVPDPRRTRGKLIAVFDDVFTGGWTLREVARALRTQGGARSVVGITLARQKYEPP